ncbi:MAG TPA: DUF4129 domain-containing protein [Thermoanaerobaculia bacterium]
MMRRALLFAIALLAFAAHAETIRIEQYLATLRGIDELLASNQLELARAEAVTLSAYDVASPQGQFHADDSLLAAIADSRVPVPQLRARLALTIDELRRATGIEGTAADRKLLEEVTKAQEVEDLKAGGEVEKLPAEIPMFDRIMKSIEEMFDWIGKQLRRLLEWIIDLLPNNQNLYGATGGMRWIVVGVALAILLIVVALAFVVIRRSRGTKPEVTESAEPIGSERDADPLSRGANEWETYALTLGSEGRYREAIRAWFHAVLVTCYSESILHFRKGRTNWEYISSLSPSHAWRPELITLTRRFEQEWYGSDVSTEEAFEDCGARARNILDALHRSGGVAA